MDGGKLLLFIELPGGELDEIGRGILSWGARLAGVLGADWGAVTAVVPEGGQLAAFGAFGTPAVTAIAGGERLLDAPALLGKAVADLAAERGATVLLLPHNDLGSTLAPVIAAALDAALLTEVAAVRRGEDGVRLSRPALGGRLAETKVWDGKRPLVLTVPTRALSQVLLPTVRAITPVLATWQQPPLSTLRAARIIGRIPPDPETVDLTEAEVIFSAGKGCDPATFEQLKELGRLLNVSFGVTRPVFDQGWAEFERMIGQTGRTVAPRLYLALGISGSMHHVGGIQDSRRIVAINNDPNAPIFTTADEGFVADLGTIVPLLLAKARSGAGGAR
ncbi:MAG: electron transfer flavoprotein subunit alpha/FixB family protein [Desulfuromonadales bacterium]|nr:electron transfer flavoprotein subunit alpha/FixB family protein [Desulfuromonadales bacterium]